MADCVDLLRSIGASCAALEQVGGVNKRVWLTQLSQIDSSTKDANGYVNTIAMGNDGSAGYKLVTITGKKFTHNGSIEGVIGANVNLVSHTAVLKLFTETPTQRANVLTMFKAHELVVFFETESGNIEIYGFDKGMEASALAGGTGTALQDDTSITLTLKGEQTTLPDYFLADGTLATSIAYLDAISAPVV